MESFFSKEIYYNTMGDWTIALLIILGVYVFSKLLYWVFRNIIKKITSHTKTRFDDILVDMLQKPIILGMTVSGIWYGIHWLSFPDKINEWVNKGFFLIIALIVTWVIARIVDVIIGEYLVPHSDKSDSDVDDHLIPVVQKVLRYVIWSLGIIVALNNAGYNVGALLAGLGIGGLALAMAAKDTVANVFGGITIFTDKPFKIKDRIVINGFDGFVEEIGIRSTKLRTLDGRIVTIPNSKFTEGFVENITSEPSRKIKLNIGLVYDTSAEQIEKAVELLQQIAKNHPSVEDTCNTSFDNFGDFSLGILFIYFIKPGEDFFNIQTDINLEIKRKFKENTLEIAFPTQTIYTKSLN
jgi:MscS family membrane protein